MEIILDAAFLGEKEQAHDYLKEMLDLPYYYGRNLDALHDCLGEKSGLTIIIKNSAGAGEYFDKLLKVFEDSCDEVILQEGLEGITDEDFDDSSDGDN